jgi:hypothetical protein
MNSEWRWSPKIDIGVIVACAIGSAIGTGLAWLVQWMLR